MKDYDSSKGKVNSHVKELLGSFFLSLKNRFTLSQNFGNSYLK